MHESTDHKLKVLTPQLSEHLRLSNSAARELQRLGIRILRHEESRLVISPEDGRTLLSGRRLIGYQRFGTAGSNRYMAQFEGVTLEWREPISYARPDTWALPTAPRTGTLQ